MDKVHIVVGYTKADNDSYDSCIMGAFSTIELAEECGNELKTAGNITYYEIESPIVDEFGYK